MPCLDAAPNPAKNDKGMEMTNAHGQDTTKKASARYSHVAQSDVISAGTMPNISAAATTAGV